MKRFDSQTWKPQLTLLRNVVTRFYTKKYRIIECLVMCLVCDWEKFLRSCTFTSTIETKRQSGSQNITQNPLLKLLKVGSRWKVFIFVLTRMFILLKLKLIEKLKTCEKGENNLFVFCFHLSRELSRTSSSAHYVLQDFKDDKMSRLLFEE